MDKNISFAAAAERVRYLVPIIGRNGVKAVIATLQNTPPCGWNSVEERLPYAELDAYVKKYDAIPEFLVMIRGALVPTALFFDGQSWIDGDKNHYAVTHWMQMPTPPERENI